MRNAVLLPIVLVSVGMLSLATEPGTPLDCSDVQFLESGFSCTQTEPLDLVAGDDVPAFDSFGKTAVDNDGNWWGYKRVSLGTCTSGSIYSHRFLRCDPDSGECQALLSLDERCPEVDGGVMRETILVDRWAFDAVRGRLLIRGISSCTCAGGSCSACGYSGTQRLFSIEGPSLRPLSVVLEDNHTGDDDDDDDALDGLSLKWTFPER